MSPQCPKKLQSRLGTPVSDKLSIFERSNPGLLDEFIDQQEEAKKSASRAKELKMITDAVSAANVALINAMGGSPIDQVSNKNANKRPAPCDNGDGELNTPRKRSKTSAESANDYSPRSLLRNINERIDTMDKKQQTALAQSASKPELSPVMMDEMRQQIRHEINLEMKSALRTPSPMVRYRDSSPSEENGMNHRFQGGVPCAPLIQTPTSVDRNIFEIRSSERRLNEASGRRPLFERSEQLGRDAQATWVMDQVNWNDAHYSTDPAGSQRQRMHSNDELQMQLLEVRKSNRRLIEKRELSRQNFQDHSNEIDDLETQRATERKIELMAQIEEARIMKKRLEDEEQLRDQLEKGNRWKLEQQQKDAERERQRAFEDDLRNELARTLAESKLLQQKRRRNVHFHEQSEQQVYEPLNSPANCITRSGVTRAPLEQIIRRDLTENEGFDVDDSKQSDVQGGMSCGISTTRQQVTAETGFESPVSNQSSLSTPYWSNDGGSSSSSSSSNRTASVVELPSSSTNTNVTSIIDIDMSPLPQRTERTRRQNKGKQQVVEPVLSPASSDNEETSGRRASKRLTMSPTVETAAEEASKVARARVIYVASLRDNSSPSKKKWNRGLIKSECAKLGVRYLGSHLSKTVKRLSENVHAGIDTE
jgi:hypothetical protein